VVEPSTGSEALVEKIQALSPRDDAQRSLQAQSLSMVIGLIQTRWLMYEQGASSVSEPMLAILVFWLIAIFISFGLFAPRNATVITALFVAGLSVSGAIFLILEMYTPFDGVIKISSAPLRAALAHLGQ
jgi:membrane-bound ClpP family serine protease